jgi:Skp family chaperone for outer membrane proteins
MHGHHEMDENMERAIEEYENDLEIQRQQHEFEQQQHEFEQRLRERSNGRIDEMLQEMDTEARFEFFCDLIEQNKNGEHNE